MHGEGGQFLLEIMVLLGCASVLIVLFYRIRLAPLLAYILTGIILGPSGAGVISDAENLSLPSELGLTFLLFILGLEFSLPRLLALRDTVFKLGGAQVILCMTCFYFIMLWWGLSWQSALIIAGGLSLSSTAIVSKELTSQNLLKTRHGEIAIGVLLFQDLAAIALLIATPLLASTAAEVDLQSLLLPVGKAIGLLVLFFITGHYLLPQFLREVARQKSDDLLVLTSLVIVLLAAILTESIGLSMELGAFLAGMMLGDTRFRHQLEADVRPFRDLLLGLFFITIGMLVDTQMLLQYWWQIILCGLGLIMFKASLIAFIARVSGESLRAAIPAGMALSQGGEFLFALLALASRDSLVAPEVSSFIVSITIVSMVLTPVIIRYSHTLVDSALLRINHKVLVSRNEHETIRNLQVEGHVLILGFGRVGQSIARFLKPLGVRYLVLETDDVRISEACAAGEPVYYGDSARLDILKAASAGNARVVIISYDDHEQACRVLEHMHSLNPAIPVLARTRDDAHLDKLMGLGATEVIPETHEASLTLVSHLLLMLNVPSREIHSLIDDARRDRYHMLHSFYHGERVGLLNRKDHPDIRHAVRLTGMAAACNKAVEQLRLPEEVELVEIRRGHESFAGEDMQPLILQRGDVLLLQGTIDEIDLAEAALLKG